MTSYELRPLRSDRPLVAFDSLDRAKAYRDQHFARARVMLRLFEVKRVEQELAA